MPCASLKRLVLDENHLGDASARSLANLLSGKSFAQLQHLGLYGNNITDVGMKALRTALCKRRKCTPQLQSVALRNNKASPGVVAAFHQALIRRGASADVL